MAWVLSGGRGGRNINLSAKITKVWTIRAPYELSFQRRVYFSTGFRHSRNPKKNTAFQRSAMSIENGISTLPHSSGVLCILPGYATSLRQF